MERVPRPRSPRIVGAQPVAPLFKPGGVRARSQVRLGDDEFEAIRLADLERMQQAQAARRMGVSRQTFGRVLGSARRKVAEALVHGRALRIDFSPGAAGAQPPLHGTGCSADPARCARCGEELVQLGPPREHGARARVERS
jgi:predicted DNA-binding protein (UPF0251 family)